MSMPVWHSALMYWLALVSPQLSPRSLTVAPVPVDFCGRTVVTQGQPLILKTVVTEEKPGVKQPQTYA